MKFTLTLFLFFNFLKFYWPWKDILLILYARMNAIVDTLLSLILTFAVLQVQETTLAKENPDMIMMSETTMLKR